MRANELNQWQEAIYRVTINWQRLYSWLGQYKWELLLVMLITGAAAFIRIYRLAEIPPGLHGDEAWTGLDALRILDEGWIGPYIGSALGQPTGPLYFTALVFALFDESIFTLRLSMAILSIATIPLAYLLFRTGFGLPVALIATSALTFSYWHLHFSRIAFMVISMPLIATLAAVATLWAMRTNRKWPWFLAGLALGAGMYSYGVYGVFVLSMAVVLVVRLVLYRHQWQELVSHYALTGLGFVLIALPLIQFIVTEPGPYFSHTQRVALFGDPQYIESDDKAGVLAQRAVDGATLLFRHPPVDGSDASGGRGALHPVLAALAYLGLAIALYRWRSPPHLLSAVAVLFGLGLIVFTAVNAGDMRRSQIGIPFVYGLAGIGAVEILALTRRFLGEKGHRLALAGAAAILVIVFASEVRYYFGEFPEQGHARWVFASDILQSVEVAQQLNGSGPIFFYSGRMSFEHESIRFLYPQVPGIDRSEEFGDFSLERLHSGPVTYVLLPPYHEALDELREMYPDGEEIIRHDQGGAISFAVYHLEDERSEDIESHLTSIEKALESIRRDLEAIRNELNQGARVE
jgi:4-amino-4-deoxy-L-arabinose transferase-like glycosyltransferase